jgi:hypothetical protein
MEHITYSLREGSDHSDFYYETIATFADEIVEESKLYTTWMIDDFMIYIQKSKKKAPRIHEEYILEVLTLGVLWLHYSDDAISLLQPARSLLSRLTELRQKSNTLKPGVDFLRGILSTILFSPTHAQEIVDSLSLTIENIDKLISWLIATGEFTQEGLRLTLWRDFFATVSEQDTADHIASAIAFAAWFEVRSKEVLGRYTIYVEDFLKETIKQDRWREDLVLRRRARVEYHLNMVGAEIMNRAYQQDFLSAPTKIVLLPTCMRKRQGQCRARQIADAYQCTSCTENCTIHELKKLGEEYGFEVYMIPHESSAFSKELLIPGEVGIIGIACVLNLMAGGWRAKSLGIPAQCVLLDYCGCKNHWHKEGFPTDINIEQFLTLFNKNATL